MSLRAFTLLTLGLLASSVALAAPPASITQELSIPALVKTFDYFEVTANISDIGSQAGAVTVNLSTSGVSTIIEGAETQELPLGSGETAQLSWLVYPQAFGNITVTLSSARAGERMVTSKASGIAFSELTFDDFVTFGENDSVVVYGGSTVNVSFRLLREGAVYANATVTATIDGVESTLTNAGGGTYRGSFTSPTSQGIYYAKVLAVDDAFASNKGTALPDVIVTDPARILHVITFDEIPQMGNAFRVVSTIKNYDQTGVSENISLSKSGANVTPLNDLERQLELTSGQGTEVAWLFDPVGVGTLNTAIAYSSSKGTSQNKSVDLPVFGRVNLLAKLNGSNLEVSYKSPDPGIEFPVNLTLIERDEFTHFDLSNAPANVTDQSKKSNLALKVRNYTKVGNYVLAVRAMSQGKVIAETDITLTVTAGLQIQSFSMMEGPASPTAERFVDSSENLSIVTLEVSNPASEAQDVTITEAIPAEVATGLGGLSFNVEPDSILPGNVVSWSFRLAPGGKLALKYWARKDLHTVVFSEPIVTTGSPVGAEIQLKPSKLKDNGEEDDKTLKAYIELPEGFDPSSIDVSTVRFNGLVPALEQKKAKLADKDEDGLNELVVKFDQDSVLEVLSPGTNIVTITGSFEGGTFTGTATLKVKVKDKKKDFE